MLELFVVLVYTKTVDSFEWDHNKNDKNKAKHGISFESAVMAFFDPFALYSQSDKNKEQREILIGSSEDGILFVVFLKKTAHGYRIISARKANKKERKAYENQW